MSDDPQARVGRGQWFSHSGPVWIKDLGDEYILRSNDNENPN